MKKKGLLCAILSRTTKKEQTMNKSTQATIYIAALFAMLIVIVAGCMNAGYNSELESVRVDGVLPQKGTGVRLSRKSSYGYWDIGAMTAVERLAKDEMASIVPVEVDINRSSDFGDSPLWARIPSFLTLTILPLYATQGGTYNIELKFPDGKATLEMVIKGHGLVSFFPTGLFPIPGWFKERTWTAGGTAFVSGDCGMRGFSKKAIEQTTYDWLKEIMYTPNEK